MLQSFTWNAIRCFVTLAAVYTIHHIAGPQLPFGPLLICAVIAIGVMKIWTMPGRAEPEKPEIETYVP